MIIFRSYDYTCKAITVVCALSQKQQPEYLDFNDLDSPSCYQSIFTHRCSIPRPTWVVPRQELLHPSWHTQTVGFAMATDADDDVRCDKMECPCAEIVYSVHDQDGRESNLLEVSIIFMSV